MVTRALGKDGWQDYFQRISKQLAGRRAEVEVVGLDIGDQIQAEWLPVIGVVYERKRDTLEVALEGLDHLINSPQAISIEEGPQGLASMEIVGSDGSRQILKFKAPLLLPH